MLHDLKNKLYGISGDACQHKLYCRFLGLSARRHEVQTKRPNGTREICKENSQLFMPSHGASVNC
jgi:hypothetical protein